MTRNAHTAIYANLAFGLVMLIAIFLGPASCNGSSSCGGGGNAYSCKACRDDCEKAGIPRSSPECHCEGCTEP
ncbi:MAG: hypothetical protein QM784_37915 [Polyangiaceae bacterium]